MPVDVLVNLHADDAIRRAVATENVGERSADKRLDAPALERLRSMFTTRTTAEVVVDNQDRGALA